MILEIIVAQIEPTSPQLLIKAFKLLYSLKAKDDFQYILIDGDTQRCSTNSKRLGNTGIQKLKNVSICFRSKKDRKEQKSNFRDYVKTVEEGDTYHEKMVINKREVLEITSWSQKKQYDTLCKVSYRVLIKIK